MIIGPVGYALNNHPIQNQERLARTGGPIKQNTRIMPRIKGIVHRNLFGV